MCKKMSKLPTCNFCPKPAAFDAKMLGHSSWAYFCEDCYVGRGSHTQGLFTKLELLTEEEAIYDQTGEESYEPDVEDAFMATVDLEEVMRESLFGSSCGVEVADGCIVEPDGKCPHGYSSPLLLAHLI